jgi:hypothetical protein
VHHRISLVAPLLQHAVSPLLVALEIGARPKSRRGASNCWKWKNMDSGIKSERPSPARWIHGSVPCPHTSCSPPQQNLTQIGPTNRGGATNKKKLNRRPKERPWKEGLYYRVAAQRCRQDGAINTFFYSFSTDMPDFSVMPSPNAPPKRHGNA